jgi:integrase
MPRGRSVSREPERFRKLIGDFSNSEKFDGFSPATQKWVLRVLGYSMRVLGDIPTTEVDPAYVQAFLDGLSDRTGIQEQARKALKMVERWALVRRRLKYPIVLGTEIVGSDGAREPWLEQEVASAIEHSPTEIGRAILLAASTGQRLGDLVRMRWDHLRVIRGRLGIDVLQQKTKLAIWAPIITEFEPVLSSWERDGLTILCRPTGAPWTRVTLANAWYRERKKTAALEPLKARALSLHGLRATAVIRLRRDGLSNALIGSVVGMSEPLVNKYCRRAIQAEDAIRAMEIREAGMVVKLPKRERPY